MIRFEIFFIKYYPKILHFNLSILSFIHLSYNNKTEYIQDFYQ